MRHRSFVRRFDRGEVLANRISINSQKHHRWLVSIACFLHDTCTCIPLDPEVVACHLFISALAATAATRESGAWRLAWRMVSRSDLPNATGPDAT